ncbi:MAG: alcohol dehydrogenase catalytic domain-containing protein, partial [Terriglobia bacterium]
QAVETLKPGGTVLIVGIPETERVSFMIHDLRRKEISVLNVRRQNKCTAAAIELIASGRVNVDPLVTHRFPLRSAKTAFDLVSDYGGGVVKALVDVSTKA